MSTIAYDVSTEMAKRIVEESIQMEKSEARRDRLNLLLYQQVEDDCLVGLFHVWNNDNGRIFLKCTADIQEKWSGWLHPIELTEKNMEILLKIRNCEDISTSILMMYTGDEQPKDWHDPEHGDSAFASLLIKHRTCVFCQEINNKPDAIDLPDIIKCFFDI
jgi:hypothetical protein